MTQTTKTLVIKVIGHPPHFGLSKVMANARHFMSAQITQNQLKGVALNALSSQRSLRATNGAYGDLPIFKFHRLAALDTHVLTAHPIAVLKARIGNRFNPNAGCFR